MTRYRMIVSIILGYSHALHRLSIKAEMSCAASSSPKNIVQGSSLPKDVSGRDERRSLQQKMALPAVQSSSLPVEVCGKDERVMGLAASFAPETIVQGSSSSKDVSGRNECLSFQQRMALPAAQGSSLPVDVGEKDERVIGCAASSAPETTVQGSSSSKDVNGRDERLSLQQRMALPAVQGSSLPVEVCEEDEFEQVIGCAASSAPETTVQGSSLPKDVSGRDEHSNFQHTPYNWVCFLTIHEDTGSFVASGFKIRLPDVGRRIAIVTSGHVTYSHTNKKYANRITVKFAGKAPIEVESKDLYAAPEYINTGNPDYDYGLIYLPGAGNSKDGFGWSAVVPDGELNNLVVTNYAYPGDKPEGTMWITGGKITSFTANQISYMNDTAGGQSGSPVFTWYGGYWTVLGVHQGATLRPDTTDGECPNYATRFTIQMIYRFLEFMRGLNSILKCIESVAFPNVYLRCDGTGVTKWEGPGGGTVNCQYFPPGNFEVFYIYPVEMPPSLASQNTYKVVIESQQFKNVFLRMDGKGMSQFDGPGGGEVNCQYTAGSYEIFFMEQAGFDARYSFRSVQFPHCYLRLDGKGIHRKLDNGGGTVNCQWYDDPSRPVHWRGVPLPYETFYVEHPWENIK